MAGAAAGEDRAVGAPHGARRGRQGGRRRLRGRPLALSGRDRRTGRMMLVATVNVARAREDVPPRRHGLARLGRRCRAGAGGWWRAAHRSALSPERMALGIAEASERSFAATGVAITPLMPCASSSPCRTLWLAVFFLLPLALVLGHRVRHQRARTRAAGRARRQLRQLQAAVHRRSLSRGLAVLAAHRRASRRWSRLLLGYPMAYAIARARPQRRPCC